MNRDAAKQSYLQNGNRLSAAGNWEEASIYYRKAIQRDDKFGEAYYQLGLSECHRGNLQGGVAALAHAAELMPARDDVKINLADKSVSLFVRDRSRVAHEQAARVISQLRDRNSFDALRLAGLLAMLDGRGDQAREYFARANTLKPLQPDLVHNYVQLLLDGNASEVQQGEKLAVDLMHAHPEFLPVYDVLYTRYSSTGREADAERILLEKTKNNPHNAHSRIQLAAHYASIDKPAQVQATIEQLLSDTAIQDRFLQAGDLFAQLRQTDIALATYRRGQQAQPAHALSYDTRIVSLLQTEGKSAEALQQVESGLATHPHDVDLEFLKAQLLADSGRETDTEQSARLLTQLLTKENRPQFHYQLGRVYATQGKRDDAERQFVQATTQRGYLEPLRALATLCLEQKDYRKATQYTESMLRFLPSDASARMLHALALRGEGNVSQAERELTALQRDFPGAEEPKLALANMLRSQGQFQAAESMFANMKPVSGDLRPLEGLAQTYFDENQPQRALSLLTAQASAPGASAKTHLLLADAAFTAQRFPLAVDQYGRAAAIDPRLAGYAHLHLADAFLHMDRVNEAIDQLQHALSESNDRKQVLAMLALAYQRAGRNKDALDTYREALAADPANPFLLNNLAYALCENNGNLDEALTLAQKARKLAPGDPRIADTVGWIYLKKRTLDAALQVFSTDVRLAPHDPVYGYHLALALEQTGDKKSARKILVAALNDKPGSVDERNMRELLSRLNRN